MQPSCRIVTVTFNFLPTPSLNVPNEISEKNKKRDLSSGSVMAQQKYEQERVPVVQTVTIKLVSTELDLVAMNANEIIEAVTIIKCKLEHSSWTNSGVLNMYPRCPCYDEISNLPKPVIKLRKYQDLATSSQPWCEAHLIKISKYSSFFQSKPSFEPILDMLCEQGPDHFHQKRTHFIHKKGKYRFKNYRGSEVRIGEVCN